MNRLKKGFTLVELLGVIIILSVIMLLVVPPLINSVDKNKKSVSSANEKLLYSATDLYISNHSNAFPKYNGSTYCIAVGSLVNEDLLDEKIYKGETDNPIDSTKTIKVDVNNYTYNMSIVDANECTYAMATPNVDFNLETIGGEKFIVIDTYGDGPNVSRITTSSGDNVPKYSKKLKVYVSGYNHKDGVDATQYARFLTENGYENEVHIDSVYPTVQYLLNNGFNTIVINRYVWSIDEVVNSYFAAGINVITTGNDSSSILTPIDSSISSSTLTNKQGNYRPIVDNNFSKRLGNLTSATTDNRAIITFIPEVEVLYSETVDGQVYDAVGGYTANDTKWVHCQVSLSPSMMEKYTLGALEYIANKDLYYYKVKRPGNYSFIIYDESGASREVSYQADDVWSWDYAFINDYQTFVAPMDGIYKLETWGAQGGNTVQTMGIVTEGGRGAYSSGEIYLQKNQTLYIYVGGMGSQEITETSQALAGPFNGGGSAKTEEGSDARSTTGGGATDIRLVNGNWNNFNSLKSRIIVAAGGGGSDNTANNGYLGEGGAAGGLVGYSGTTNQPNGRFGNGGEQTKGGVSNDYSLTYTSTGQFGKGAGGEQNSNSGAGGGGYFGGSAGHGFRSGGGGGSSYISGHEGCNSVTSSSTSTNISFTDSPNHSSGKVFRSTTMIDGKGCKWTNVNTGDCNGFKSPSGVNELGHIGNGHARITYVNDASAVNITYDYNYMPNDILRDEYNTNSYNYCCGQLNNEPGTVTSVSTTVDTNGIVYSLTGKNGWYFSKVGNPLTLNAKYTLSFEAKASENTTAGIGSEQTSYSNYSITTDWKRYSQTFTVTSDNSYRALVFYRWYKTDHDTTLYIRNLQLQQGNPYTQLQVYKIGDKLTDLPSPSRINWTFDGWYTDPIGGTKITSNTRAPESDITYYAHWKLAKTSSVITFNANGSTVSPVTKNVVYGSTYGDLPTPANMSGYTFAGWYNATYDKEKYVRLFNDQYNSNVNTLRISPDTNYYSNSTQMFENGDIVEFDVSFEGTTITGVDINDFSLPSGSYTIDNNRIYGSVKLTTPGMFATHGDDNVYYSFLDITLSGIPNLYKVNKFKVIKFDNQVLSTTKVTDLADHTLYAKWNESVPPTLSLSKITYIEGFDGWTFSNASVDGSGVLTIGANGSAGSAAHVFDVGKGKHYATFDAWTNTSAPQHNPKGGVLAGLDYYDINMNSTQEHITGNNYSANGWSGALTLNTWETLTINYGNDIYGFDKVAYTFSMDGSYSKPVVKMKNFKFYGEAIPNSFYLINITSSDNVGVVETKYAKGNQNASYFASNGTVVTNNIVRVTENGVYTVFVKDASGNSTVKTITITNITQEFAYNGNSTGSTGSYQVFTAPMTGTYRIETWGAQGGDGLCTFSQGCANNSGGKGAYARGDITLTQGEKLYVYVGGKGTTATTVNVNNAAGYNGGGTGGSGGVDDSAGGGGGATDIRYFSSTPSSSDLAWNSTNGLNARIMVASGGGGGSCMSATQSFPSNLNINYRNAVGISLPSETVYGYYNTHTCNISDVNQTTGNSFGIGQSATSNSHGAGGGGGGFYGGTYCFSSGHGSGGSGGSAYISGHTGCVAKTAASGCTSGTTTRSCSIHSSNKSFTNTSIIDGSGYIWTNTKGAYKGLYEPNGVSSPGHTGNGYARITLISAS